MIQSCSRCAVQSAKKAMGAGLAGATSENAGRNFNWKRIAWLAEGVHELLSEVFAGHHELMLLRNIAEDGMDLRDVNGALQPLEVLDEIDFFRAECGGLILANGQSLLHG